MTDSIPYVIRRHSAWWRGKYFRAVLVLALAGSVTGMQAKASIKDGPKLLDTPEFIWSEPEEIQLFGVPASWRRFTTAMPVEKAARILSGQTHLFQQVVAFRQKIILFGMQAGWHWVADLESTEHGAQGTISALDASFVHLNEAVENRSNLTAIWVPVQARLLYSEKTLMKGRPVVQQIYKVAWPLGKLNLHVREHLQISGWHDALGQEQLINGRVWQRKSERLMLISHEISGGSALFIHHFQ